MKNPAFNIKCRVSSIQYCLMLFLLLCLCASSWSAVERAASSSSKIVALQMQISALEEQKGQLEAKKQKLVTEGDELSYKIEALKMQAKSGLGIIGRYRLSRNLRKAQALSEKIQALEKKIHEIESELKDRKSELESEYERQIAVLLEKLNGSSQAEETREILEKVKEYQAAKEQLAEPEKEEQEHLDIMEIEIKEHDGPQEIREKADLINDFANKLNDRMNMLSARVGKLRAELKTREKLGEFAEEISFFGERISREEIAAADSGEEPDEIPVERSAEERTALESDTFAGDASIVTLPTKEPPEIIATQPPATPGKMVVERNGVSADFAGTSLDQIEKQIKLLEKQRRDLEKELSKLSEKANSFYKKADEIEKSEIKPSGKER